MVRLCVGIAASSIVVAACAAFSPEIGDLRPASIEDGAGTSGGEGTSGGAIGEAGVNGDGSTSGDAGGGSEQDASTDGSDAGPKTWVVSVGPNSKDTFSPKDLTIRAGDEVRWVWISGGHSLISSAGLFCAPNNTNCASAPELPKGTVYTRTFPTPGVFPYQCGSHLADGMTGSITVQ